MMHINQSLLEAFMTGWRKGGVHCRALWRCVREDKEMRENLSESQLDKMLKDSFPASDPPSVY